jgi:hypothetical protein
MASEIIVQTIKGPTSGANANKIIVPSGQTLDASAGFNAPSGTIIQIKDAKVTSFSSINCANVWASLMSVTITPKDSNSRFFITGHAQIGNPSSGGLEMGLRIRREVGGVSGYPCIANASGSTTQSTLGNQVTGSNPSYEGWTPSWSVYDEPSSAGDITYYLEYFGSENQTAYYNRFQTTANASYNVHGTTTLTVMEIAG